ncbi:hypothetical protein [Exiguobacterium sp. AT1b]|uniref:Uncharacterized protein n=1 Tax=Exiguobacterium sp. (strain ATCC BAA-1283 / AT1b) TaxID=360911 RepID=C4L3X1_EXISA|nr:hypothetical protein [Exiguobacterium sp. AT1b]ACQ71466.1 hypothetical protein EAT1b_2548 [Exiguobacterium sp. AT1b]
MIDPWIIVSSLLSAIFVTVVRNVNEYFKDKIKVRKAKKLLGKELKDNLLYLSRTVKVLKIFNDINIIILSDEDFKENYCSDEKMKELMKSISIEADRHLNLISVLVYKEIFLKSNRNFDSKQDELLHEIYFYILKVENYKSIILSNKDNKDIKRLYELYFKVWEISNNIMSLCDDDLIKNLIRSEVECAVNNELNAIEQTSVEQ